MFKNSRQVIFVVAWGMLACTPDPEEKSHSETVSVMDDDELSACNEVSSTPVAWSAESAMGIPEVVFANVAGTCEAPLSWDGSGWGEMLTVSPVTGESTVTATVTLNQESVKLVEREPAISGGDPFCPKSLEVDATVTLETTEGGIVAAQPVTVRVTEENGDTLVSFFVASSDFGNWLTITPDSPDATASLSVSMMPVAEGCVGEVGLNYEKTIGKDSAGSSQIRFASWSDTGCYLGEIPVDISEPYEGEDIPSAISEVFGDASISGTWETGGATTLALTSTITEMNICAETIGSSLDVVVPVEIVAGTADGLLSDLTGNGTVRASFLGEGLTQLQFWSSIDVACESTTDTLPYTSLDCAQVESITAQLGFNKYYGVSGNDEGELEIYIYHRESTASPGAADEVHRIQLSPTILTTSLPPCSAMQILYERKQRTIRS